MESSLATLFLGVIALGVLGMAVGQLVLFVSASRALTRIGETVQQLERDLRPVVASLQAMTADAARATAQAASQVERAERLLDDVTRKVEEMIAGFRRSILSPARDGLAILHGIRAAFAAFSDLGSKRRAESPVAVPDPGDEDHASFIG